MNEGLPSELRAVDMRLLPEASQMRVSRKDKAMSITVERYITPWSFELDHDHLVELAENRKVALRLRTAQCDELRAENAKLRELVQKMWLYDYAGKFSSKREDMDHVAMVYKRMRDLGIEVDG